MLAIAQGLLCNAKLLMVDELSLGLAPILVASILDAIRTLNQEGLSILLVEQSLNVSTTIAERAMFMEKGEVRFTGSTADLQDTDLVRSVFVKREGESLGSGGLDAVAARKKAMAAGNGAGSNGSGVALTANRHRQALRWGQGAGRVRPERPERSRPGNYRRQRSRQDDRLRRDLRFPGPRSGRPEAGGH